jgi:hypothetical protein
MAGTAGRDLWPGSSRPANGGHEVDSGYVQGYLAQLLEAGGPSQPVSRQLGEGQVSGARQTINVSYTLPMVPHGHVPLQ